MKMKAFYILSIFLFFSGTARAEQDFYGIQMKNELWAQNLVLGSGPSADPSDLAEGPVLSHAIHAEASLKPAGNDRLSFQVNVINDSGSEISSDYEYRDFFIYTKDGRKFPLIDENQDPKLNTIGPKASRIFTPSLGNLRLQNEDVAMVGCSFDLGRVQIYLFPWSRKEEVSRLTSPAAPPEPPKKSSGGFLSRFTRKKSEPAPAPSRPSMMSSQEPVRESAPAAAPPTTQGRLDQAIKNFVYKPSIDNKTASARPAASAASAVPAAATAAPAPADNVSTVTGTKTEAHVIGIDKQYNFVTLSVGFKDGLRQNMPITILRDGKPVAKAKVKQLRDRVAAAILLPGTVRSEVRAGDKISLA